LLLVIAGGFLFIFLSEQLGALVQTSSRESLLTQTNIAARGAALEIADLHTDSQVLASTLARLTGSRVTVVSRDGSVLADSEVDPSQIKFLENHADRPEIKEAFRLGQAATTRYSATLQTMMVYAAVQFQDRQHELAVVRLALPLTSIGTIHSIVNTTLGQSFCLAFAIALLLSVLLSRLNMRPLQRIAAVVGDIGRGNYARRLPIDERDELGNMAKIINEMAERIEEQVISLGAERSQLQAILSGLGEGLLVGDASGTVQMVNAAFCELFEVKENIVGRSLISISRHPSLHESFKAIILHKRAYTEEIVINAERERVVRVHWVPLLDENRLQGIIAVFHDISDLKRLENIRKDFVANVSHELRTPVTIIKGYAETLLGGAIKDNPEKAHKFVEIIYSHSDRLANLLRDLLSLSEMESDEFVLQLQPMSLSGVFRQACLLLEAKATTKAITISSEGVSAGAQVLAESGRLEQVFVNLIDNAIKYSPNKSMITVRVEDQDAFLKVSVSDNGPGIPPQSLPRIFERFYRVDAGRSRGEGGTGLGLSIVKHIVQLHGGSISVESNYGQGTTFHFTLKKAEIAK
jgi:two-component system phosphate regulon sensor histidine kinase PhoR